MLPIIPEMTDPLGRYWEQPCDIRDAPIDDETVLLTPAQFASLHEYSATFPTGVYPGKCWKRIEDKSKRVLLVWYGAVTPDDQCPIEFRNIEIVSDAPPGE
jgi:hypothetical protein